MKPIFCIVGKSGAGKTTYLDAIMKDDRFKEMNIKELKYHTTRSKRFPEEDSYYFVTNDEYKKDVANKNVIESRKYKKVDEEVVYYTSKDDMNIEDCNALICAASVDQLIAYYNSLADVYIINIKVDAKPRIQRLINRCNTDNEVYEVCRRATEENTEYNKLYALNLDLTKYLIIDNSGNMDNDFNDNLDKIYYFISDIMHL